MGSVYRKDDNYVDKPNRNVFYKTYESNLSTKFGQIVPCFCRPVMNGETIKIDPKMNLNFLPLVFPVQNRVRASLSFYYVRNRNLWKDWEDFQFKMKDGLVPPYFAFKEGTYRDMLRVGGLLDHLGVPTVLHGSHSVFLAQPLIEHFGYDNWYYDAVLGIWEQRSNFQALQSTLTNQVNRQPFFTSWYDSVISSTAGQDSFLTYLFHSPIKVTDEGDLFFYATNFDPERHNLYLIVNRRTRGDVTVVREGVNAGLENKRTTTGKTQRQGGSASSVVNRVSSSSAVTASGADIIETGIVTCSSGIVDDELNTLDLSSLGVTEVLGYIVPDDQDYANISYSFRVNVKEQYGDIGLPLEYIALDSLPFPYYRGSTLVDDNTRLHISTLPARAIQSIYNSHIRNEANNPFMINGVPEYNKFISNYEGGPDSDKYELFYRNWQDDCFTTALHSPQHGNAPLVGLVNGSDAPYIVTFANNDGTTSRVYFNTSANAVRVFDSVDSVSDGYAGQLQEAMVEAVKFGISINDFRNVNSFQRWLENNVRKGYKYRDQIKSHYGVSVKFDVLDMPEYLGGMSRDMNVNAVTQTVENDFGNLGDFSGQAWIKGEMESSISHFCDEDGYVIGLLSVDPIVPYTQHIPKYLLRDSAFDWYSPEFGKIGMQPILNREISPLQSFYEGNADKVFGYQRAWYDSLDGLSEVHGRFRTDFRNFLIHRTFDTVPKLGADFLTMSDDDINNIFYVDDGEDKIIGQVLFDYESILPIPMYGIPALE